MKVARAEQADHAVAQILALHEDEDQHHEHDAHGCQRLEQRQQKISGHLDRRRFRLMDFHRQGTRRLGGRRRGRAGRCRRLLLRRRLGDGLVEAAAEIFQESRQLSEGSFPREPILLSMVV